MIREFLQRIRHPFRPKSPFTPAQARVENFCKQFATLPCMEDLRIREAVRLVGLRDWEDHIDLRSFQSDLLGILMKRVKEYNTIRLSWKTQVLLVLISDNPATIVMYLAYLQYWGYTHHKRFIDFGQLVHEIFPHGFPNEASLKSTWYGQKVTVDRRELNLLDIKEAYHSIQIPPEGTTSF